MSNEATAVQCVDELIEHVNEEVIDLQKSIDWQKSLGESGGVAKMRHTRDAYQVVLEWLAVLREKIVALDIVTRQSNELVALAKLAATGPAFFNPLEAALAERIRDRILRERCKRNPDGSLIESEASK